MFKFSSATGFTYFINKVIFGLTEGASPSVQMGTAPPVSGTFAAGSMILNSAPAPALGGVTSWLCTVAGTPGTWLAIQGGAYQATQDEGGALTARVALNFVGPGVTATDDPGNNRTVVTIPGGGAFYQTAQDEGGALTQRGALNFVGLGVTATDDAGNNRTVVTIPGATIPGFVAVTTKAELVAAAASIGGGTITLAANVQYLIAGNIDLTITAGIPGSTFGDKILMGSGSSITGAGQGRYSITGNSGNYLITSHTAGNVVKNILMANSGGGGAVELVNSSGTSVLSELIVTASNPAAITIANAGTKELAYCRFSGSAEAVKTAAATSGSVLLKSCTFNSVTSWINVQTGHTVARLRGMECVSEASQGTSNFTIAGTVTSLEIADCLGQTGGTNVNNTGTVTGAIITSNTWIVANQNSVFSGFSPTVGGAAPVATFTLLRSNLWRNAAASSFFLLRESATQTANNPPV